MVELCKPNPIIKELVSLTLAGRLVLGFIKRKELLGNSFYDMTTKYISKLVLKAFEDAVDYRKYLEVKYCGKETGH